ncbi:MAG: glycosyltransferase family 39 protein, partial [bacterium]
MVISAVACRGERLRDVVPPPTRRNRIPLLLAVLALGLILRSYHLDIKPPGHAHHSAETGIFAAQMAHDCPWDFTSSTRLGKAVSEFRRIFTNEPGLEASLAQRHYECGGYKVYHFSLELVSYELALNWIAFTIWGSHFIIQRALSVVLGVLAIYILFLLAEDFFGTSVGLLAALFMAVCPWNNAHSRYGEVCFAITMLCATLTMLCATRAIQRRSIGWTIALIFNLALDFYVYPSTQFIVPVVIALWLYSMVQNRRSWKSLLIIGLASLAVVALLSAPRTNIFGPAERISLINSPINTRIGYGVQSYRVMAVNAVKLAKSLLIEATDRDCWFKKEGAILLWPMGLLFMGGLAWCLPRLSDSRYAVLVIWFFMGILPTIPSPDVL